MWDLSQRQCHRIKLFCKIYFDRKMMIWWFLVFLFQWRTMYMHNMWLLFCRCWILIWRIVTLGLLFWISPTLCSDLNCRLELFITAQLSERPQDLDSLRLFPIRGQAAQKAACHMLKISVLCRIAAVLIRLFEHIRALEVFFFMSQPNRKSSVLNLVDKPNIIWMLCFHV